MDFTPDYRNIVDAAYNRPSKRLPLYEHYISPNVMETVLGKKFQHLAGEGENGLREYYKKYCEFFLKNGYDTVSFECCVGPVMPGSGALGNHKPGVIKNMADFKAYPWNDIPDLYFQNYSRHFKALGQVMPAGMKGVGGVGNGVFECVQDVVGYMDLCFISSDDPQLYEMLFDTVGDLIHSIWKRFLPEFGDTFCVCRMGDDLGYKSNTLLAAEDMKRLIIPQYRKITDVVHSFNKPFLLHSCGCIFNIFDEIINEAKIDAKHSNEDQIAPFDYWVEKYGDRIGNFGGIDTDALCRLNKVEMKEYILPLLKKIEGHGGVAFSSGNSIPDYVPVENYLNMIEIIRESRGE